jgi:hypothetical protein
MQPYTFSPWIWRDPGLIGGSIERGNLVDGAADDEYVDDAEADEAASEGIAGFHVEAADGHIGSIDEASYEVGGAYLVVDTGPWIFGRKVLLPAGTVQRVDRDERKVYVDRTKQQIKDSPEYDKETFSTPRYREQVGAYYTDSYRDAPAASRNE